jgi:hypothetical protein
MYEEKIASYIMKLEISALSLQDIMFGYQKYWWPSLKFTTPIISFKPGGNVLSKLHAMLLLTLRVIKTFPVAMRYSLIELGSLESHFLEVESIS